MNTQISIDPGMLNHAHNPSPRVSVAIIADVSASMAGQPITAMQRGLRLFLNDIANDPLAQLRCDPTIFSVGGGVTQSMPWESTMVGMTPLPELVAAGDTPLGLGVKTAISAVKSRTELYRKNATASWKPWIVMLTDGHPTDRGWEAAAAELSDLVTYQNWNVIPVATGPQANVERLARFSPKLRPLIFRDADATACFSEFFQWLSTSIRVSSRKPTDSAVQLAPLPPHIDSAPVILK